MTASIPQFSVTSFGCIYQVSINITKYMYNPLLSTATHSFTLLFPSFSIFFLGILKGGCETRNPLLNPSLENLHAISKISRLMSVFKLILETSKEINSVVTFLFKNPVLQKLR